MQVLKKVLLSLNLVLLAGILRPAQAQIVQNDMFTFVRIKYSAGGGAFAFRMRFNSDSWEVDYPTAEENFLRGMHRLTQLPVNDQSLAVTFSDPEIFQYPFAYMLEVGNLKFSQAEADTLREWCLRGGFLMIDDFHGTAEWENFRFEFSKAFPDREPVRLQASHPIFHCYHDFSSYPRVPGLGPLLSGRVFERDGYDPECWGIFDDSKRLMVLINHNVDIGDSWEHAADPRYPPEFSRVGYKLGINYIVYALTH